jgi:uncharacterized protein
VRCSDGARGSEMSSELLVLNGIVALGAILQGSVGMGFALIVVPVLALLHPAALPVTVLLLLLPLTSVMAWQERRELDVEGLGWIVLGRLPGAAIGALTVLVLSSKHLLVIIGIAIISAAAVGGAKRSVERTGRRGLVAVGLVSGTLETSSGLGGPPLSLAYRSSPPEVMRPTVAASLAIGEVISLLALGIAGEVHLSRLALAVEMLPGVLVGLVLSNWTAQWLSARVIRVAISVLAIASGLLAITRAIT